MICEKSCGAVVYRIKEGNVEFLAVRSEAYSHWGFPKGHVEAGETEHETAKREIYEETGLEVTFREGFRNRIEYSPSDGVWKEVIYFVARASNQPVLIQQGEIHEYKWAGFEEILKLLTYESSKDTLRDAHRFLLKKGF
jgi:bis(5'-nucleosidyl)-tetraphosphatase